MAGRRLPASTWEMVVTHGGTIALNVGVELPVNDIYRYDWRAYAYFIWDFADGGLFDGW